MTRGFSHIIKVKPEVGCLTGARISEGHKPDFEPPTDSENTKSVGDLSLRGVRMYVRTPGVSLSLLPIIKPELPVFKMNEVIRQNCFFDDGARGLREKGTGASQDFFYNYFF